MMTRRGCLIGGLGVFAAALIYFASYAGHGLAYDEGYLLDGVERLMDGQLIYRDFHHTYAPGRFYALAAAFGIFGKNIMVERYVFAFLQALKCGLAFAIVAMISRSWLALIAPVLLMIAPGPWHKVFFSSFGFLALYTVMRSLGGPPRRFVLCGAVIGLCAVFRQDSAGFAAIGGAIGLVLHALTDARPGMKGTAWRQMFSSLVFLVTGLAAVGVPVLLFFKLQGALGPMAHKLLREGMIDNMTNRIAYPSITAAGEVDGEYLSSVLPVRLLFYLPFAVYALAAIPLVRGAVSRRWSLGMTRFTVALAVCLLAFNQSVWRSDLGHLMQSMQFVLLLAALLLAFAVNGMRGAWKGQPWLRRASILLLMLALPGLLVCGSVGVVRGVTNPRVTARFAREGVSIVDSEYLGSVAVRAGNDTKLGLSRAPVYVTPGEARFFEALGEYLDRNTSAGDYVLAVPQLQMLYFFYDRRNPTRYSHYRRALDPGDEAGYIEDIAAHGTEYIFLTEPAGGGGLGGTRQSFSEYAAPVWNWIHENYVPVGRIGTVQILHRKS